MSAAGALELALAALGLAACGLSAWTARRFSGRVALEQAVYAGLAAFAAAALGGGLASTLLALGLATGAGALVGFAAAGLDAPRGAALGLLLQLGWESLAPRLALTGGHMGRTLGPAPDSSTLFALSLAGGLALAFGPRLLAGRPGPTRWARRSLAAAEAPALFASLGGDARRAGALAGLAVGLLSGAGGLLLAAPLEHLHFRAFDLGLGLDAVAIAILVGPRGSARAAGARAIAFAAGWVLIVELFAGHPALRAVLLALVLGGGALRLAAPRTRPGAEGAEGVAR